MKFKVVHFKCLSSVSTCTCTLSRIPTEKVWRIDLRINVHLHVENASAREHGFPRLSGAPKTAEEQDENRPQDAQFSFSRTAAHAPRETERQCLGAKADISLAGVGANSVSPVLHNFRGVLRREQQSRPRQQAHGDATYSVRWFCGDHQPRGCVHTRTIGGPQRGRSRQKNMVKGRARCSRRAR